MAAFKKGLAPKNQKIMLALLAAGKSVKVVSEWLQVDPAYVKDFAPKPKPKPKTEDKKDG